MTRRDCATLTVGRGARPQLRACWRNLAELDQRRIAVPERGARVIVWLARPVAPPLPPEGFALAPPGGPGGLPAGMTAAPTAPEGGFWVIPTLRQFAPSDLPVRERWIEHSASIEAAVRRRLGHV